MQKQWDLHGNSKITLQMEERAISEIKADLMNTTPSSQQWACLWTESNVAIGVASVFNFIIV